MITRSLSLSLEPLGFFVLFFLLKSSHDLRVSMAILHVLFLSVWFICRFNVSKELEKLERLKLLFSAPNFDW